MPGAVGVNAPDPTGPPLDGYATVDVKIAVVAHVASFGPYSWKVTVGLPVGLTRPVTVAVSLIKPLPSTTSGEAVVEIVDVARFTVMPLDDPAAKLLNAPGLRGPVYEVKDNS